MSRVTVYDLYESIRIESDNDKVGKMENVEIVPRKIVEMIIEHLYEQMNACVEGGYADYVLHNSIKYAESLLKQFEEDDSSNTKKCSEEPLPFDFDEEGC